MLSGHAELGCFIAVRNYIGRVWTGPSGRGSAGDGLALLHVFAEVGPGAMPRLRRSFAGRGLGAVEVERVSLSLCRARASWARDKLARHDFSEGVCDGLEGGG